MIVSYVLVGLGTVILLWVGQQVKSLRRNIAFAKASGLPYRVSRMSITPIILVCTVSDFHIAVSGMSNYLWVALSPLVVKILKSFPYTRKTLWPG